MSDERQKLENRPAQLEELTEHFETLKVLAVRARERADEAIRHTETLLERAAKRAAQWLDGR